MSKIQSIIENLKSINVQEDNARERIEEILKNVGGVAFVEVTLDIGNAFIRARPNKRMDNEEYETFINFSDLNFKPQAVNECYQRASTPNKTMFYGVIVPTKIIEGVNPRCVGMLEALPSFRNKTLQGIKKITYGKWTLIKPIKLLAIIPRDKFIDASKYLKELDEAYQTFLSNAEINLKNKSISFFDFLAEKFSEANIQDHKDYMISAIYSEIVTNKRFDGIMYPSVRAAGKGFNVAITEETALKSIKLSAAGENFIYKNKGNTKIFPHSRAEFIENEKIKFVKDSNYKSKEECLKELNVIYLPEL
ncbi:hypothetical protein VB796_12740 [Arcicella sp. LKC2W]|uniref:hypothetical protein n=1 Tax=Arcicella sp. LKC2W TaxID=2984198 RepID=UPI002B20173B|nr:hypothetical protein [Arcicella sp. LKC2W]MEA5459914.1 hypothetical protein [Arcicella sp. LKC2W]